MSECIVNGQEPRLAGQACTGLVLAHFFDGCQIEVSVVHLRIGEQWHRLYFEPATVFWRSSEAPDPAHNTELTHGLLLNDLSAVDGLVGYPIQGIEYQASSRGDVHVDMAFGSGRHLRFEYDVGADRTRIVADAPAADCGCLGPATATGQHQESRP